MTVRAIHGDMLQVVPQLVSDGVVCDACVCDPPYHLIATQKRFGAATSTPAQYGHDGAMARLSGGFMGQKWDGGDIAFCPETWATVGSILRPGAFLLAFGGTRTYHRLACAIEDSGFVVQDCLMWLFGTGFPKRRDALKPSYEPIIVAYKPGGKRELQIDECRIGTTENLNGGAYSGGTKDVKNANAYYTGTHAGVFAQPTGRWPANLAHDGSDEVVGVFPQSKGGAFPAKQGQHNASSYSFAGGKIAPARKMGDSGSAARFFFSSKAGTEDRWGSRHPTVKPVELVKWLVSLVTPPNGTVIDPFAGSGTTGVAALSSGRNAILIEREDQYIADIRERLAFYEGGDSHSVQAKNRNRQVDHGPLFAEAAE